jgi:hypothetical protein
VVIQYWLQGIILTEFFQAKVPPPLLGCFEVRAFARAEGEEEGDFLAGLVEGFLAGAGLGFFVGGPFFDVVEE